MNESTWDVVVVGGINSDYLIKGPILPSPGETLQGDLFFEGPGGKGANQAVAASRLGARVAFVGMIGADTRGRQLIAALEAEGVDTRHIGTGGEPTGVALIMVGGDGQKQIFVAAGANRELSPADIERAAETIASARVLLVQLEVDIACTLAAARIAHRAGVRVVLDPAPAHPIPAELYTLLALIRPNASEAGVLTGIDVTDRDSARRAARALIERGAGAAIVQAGDEGNLLIQGGGELFMAKVPVTSVDATGAGDAFAAAMAVMIAEDCPLDEAAVFANTAAALATTKFGAQAGLPHREEISEMMALREIGYMRSEPEGRWDESAADAHPHNGRQ